MKAGAEEAGEPPKDDAPKTAENRGISILDLIMRIVAVIGTLGSAIAMGTTNESLPFFTQFIRFRAEYNDLPAFRFFVVANSIVTAYLILSLALSIFHIVKSSARVTRTVLIIFDTAMLAFLTSGASAAAAIVYLAHKGNTRVNWFAICQQFNSFCELFSWILYSNSCAYAVDFVVCYCSVSELIWHGDAVRLSKSKA